MESAAAGILAGINVANALQGKAPLILPKITMLGAMIDYITNPETKKFQPMGANFGLLPELPERIRDKRERYGALAARGLAALEQILSN